MPAGGLIVGGIGALGSAAVGGISSAHQQANAQQAAFQAAQQYLSLIVPDPAEQQVILQKYQMTGEMDPRLATAFQQSGTDMSKISVNPALESAQMGALSSLQNQAENGGHTLAQDAYLNQLEQKVNAENAGRQGAIEQQFEARGMGQPSGLMLSALEQNNQNMTQNENEASMKAAADAQQNALQALQGAGTVAGQMRQQDFNQKAAVAQAQDQINQFNTRMNQGVEDENVAAKNRANEYNVQEGQQIANQNTNLSNQQQMYNKQLIQQQYQNQLQKAGGAAAGYEGEAGQYNNAANTQGNMWGNISQGIAKGAGAYAAYKSNKDANKSDEENSDSSSGDSGW